MSTFTVVAIIIAAFALAFFLLEYGFRGRRESRAQDAKTYKRGRI